MVCLFDDPHNVATITVEDILSGRQPILLVSHDESDGTWQFMPNTPIREEDGRVVSLRAIVTMDPSVEALHDLPLGWKAVRSAVGEPWRRWAPDNTGTTT